MSFNVNCIVCGECEGQVYSISRIAYYCLSPPDSGVVLIPKTPNVCEKCINKITIGGIMRWAQACWEKIDNERAEEEKEEEKGCSSYL